MYPICKEDEKEMGEMLDINTAQMGNEFVNSLGRRGSKCSKKLCPEEKGLENIKAVSKFLYFTLSLIFALKQPTV